MFYAILRFGMRSAGAMAIHSIGIVPLCYLKSYPIGRDAMEPIAPVIFLLFITFLGSLWFDGVLCLLGWDKVAHRLIKGTYHIGVAGFFLYFAIPAYREFRYAWDVGSKIRRELGEKAAGVRIAYSPHELAVRVDDPAFDDADLPKVARCAAESGLNFDLHLTNSAVTYASVSRFGDGEHHVDIYLYGPRFGKEGLEELAKHPGWGHIHFVDTDVGEMDFEAPWWTDPPLSVEFMTEDDVWSPDY